MKTPIFSMRLPADLRRQINEIAHQEDRSVAYIVIKLLRHALVAR
jgi:hypothetical protein